MPAATRYEVTELGQVTVDMFESPRINSWSTEVFVRAWVCLKNPPRAIAGYATVVYGPYDAIKSRAHARAKADIDAMAALRSNPRSF